MNTEQLTLLFKDVSSFNIPRKILGMRTAAILETLAFLIIVTLYDAIFGDGKRFIGTSPHPFTIIVVLVSVQYGTLEGLFATVMSTLFLYVDNVPDQRIGETLFDYQFRIVLMPMIWFMAAFVIGELRMRLDYENQRLYLELVEVRKRAAVISQEFEMLKNTKENLEAHLVSQTRNVTKVFHKLHYLETLSAAQIMLKIGNVIGSSINAKKFSVYTIGDNGFEIVSSEGWSQNDRYSLRIRIDHPLFIELAANQRIVSLINEDDEKILENEGIIACPLIDSETGQLFGMIKIEEMDFKDLNLITMQTIKTLCHLIGMSYTNARKYRHFVENSIFAETSHVFSPRMLKIRGEYHRSLSLEFNIPVWKVMLDSTKGRRLWIDEKEAILKGMERITKECMPGTASLYLETERLAKFVILLPGVHEKMAVLYAGRIQALAEGDELLSQLGFTAEANPF